MDDDIKGFIVGFIVASFVALMIFINPMVGCRSGFQKEAMGNGCGKLVCDTNGACEFEWTCSE